MTAYMIKDEQTRCKNIKLRKFCKEMFNSD